jgi:hypothetical protein
MANAERQIGISEGSGTCAGHRLLAKSADKGDDRGDADDSENDPFPRGSPTAGGDDRDCKDDREHDTQEPIRPVAWMSSASLAARRPTLSLN